MTGELSKDQINNILTSQVIGRLACTDGNKPYIVPVTYKYDGEFIYGQSNDGAKLKILRHNPNVCFEVDLISSMYNWQSVVVHGKFEELNKKASDKAREILFGGVFPLMTKSSVHTHEHDVTAELDDSIRVKLVMYRIRIQEITGRFQNQ